MAPCQSKKAHKSTKAPKSKPTSTASFEAGRLPDEIVRVIAIYLQESSLQSLAAVSRRIYNICRPLLWKRLIFPAQHPLSLSKLTEVILPKHGHYVLSIGSKNSADWYESSPADGSVASNTSRHRLLDSSESLTPENVIEILSCCPNLQTFNLKFEEPEEGDEGSYAAQLKAQRKAFSVHFQKLVPNLGRLQQLRHLGLHFALNFPTKARTIATMLLELPLLESLRLSCISPEDQDDQGKGINALGQAICNLKQLNALWLSETDFRNASWPTCPTLEELEMIYCHNFEPWDAARLINTFAPNLIRLALDFSYPSFSVNPKEDMTVLKPHHLFHLPRLEELFRTWDSPKCQLLNCFKNSTKLCRISYCGVKLGRYPRFVELICASPSHWPELKHLEVRTDFTPGRGHNHEDYTNRLQNFCREQDIDLKLRIAFALI